MAGENLVNRPKTFKAWCENFWYHYKFHTITALVAIFALVIITAQCATKTQYDYTIMLSTASVEWANPQIKALEKELVGCGKDLNGDGEVNIVLVDCTYNEKATGYQMIMAKRQKLQSMIMNEPNALILISDPASLNWINDEINNGFSANTNLPDGDGHFFNMTDTKLLKNAKAKTSDEFIWPEELVVSRRRIKGTLFENKRGMGEKTRAADEFIKNIVADKGN